MDSINTGAEKSKNSPSQSKIDYLPVESPGRNGVYREGGKGSVLIAAGEEISSRPNSRLHLMVLVGVL